MDNLVHAAPHVRTPDTAVHVSHWEAFVRSLLAATAVAAVAMTLSAGAAGLFLLLLYAIPTNSILPLPHEPGLLFFAPLYPPLWAAAAATAGTGIAALTDYALVEAALRHPRIRRASQRPLFRWAVRQFSRRPFVTLLLFAFTPLPVYIVRVLAPAAGYARRRYVAAMMLGRFPRFFVVAAIGHAVPVPWWMLVAITVVLVGGAALTLINRPLSA